MSSPAAPAQVHHEKKSKGVFYVLERFFSPFCSPLVLTSTNVLLISNTTEPSGVDSGRRGGGTNSSRSGAVVRAYLVAYNVLSAAGWTLVLYRTLAHLSGRAAPLPSSSSSLLQSLKKPSGIPLPVWVPSIVPAHLVPLYQRACTTFDAVGSTTAIVQSGAVLEVLHVLLGLVRSPLPTTAVQVASRLFSVWCIADRFPSVRLSS